MNWELLHERFVAASRPEPPPCGDDAVEWDYSRVSRALGLLGDESLADRPWDGLAIVSVRAAKWEEAAASYRRWAGEVGWRFVRVSAAPVADVPDPVPLAIARQIVPDELFVGGALRARMPRVGPRPRSPGASTPFRPGERWMIALDRVRRRCRVEAANEGLVLFVEAAHHLSPASLDALVFLLNVHRGWRGRMLSAPGKCYVVLAVPPEQESVLTERLERFRVASGYAFTEEAGGAGAPALPPQLDVESEHLLAALADAPLALTAADVGSLFGRSAVARIDALIERGLVVAEKQGASPSFRAAPHAVHDLPEPPPRVRRAMIERYRERARRGHEHTLLAAALLALRMGDLPRAIVFLGRSSQGDAPALSSHLFGELVAGLDAAVDRMRAGDVAALFALNAHQRRYDRCLQLARALADRPFRSEADLLRVLVHVLCVGHAHLNHALPEGFWLDLEPGRVDGSLVDAAAILGDLFTRLKWMTLDEVRNRYRVASRALAHLPRLLSGPTRKRRARGYDVASLLAQIDGQVEAALRLHYYDERSAFGPLAVRLKRAMAPAYLRATLVSTESRLPFKTESALYDRRDFSLTFELAAADGNGTSAIGLQYIRLQRLIERQLSPLGRSVSDCMIVGVSGGVLGFSPAVMGSLLVSIVGERDALRTVARFMFADRTNRPRIAAETGAGPRALVWHLVRVGDLAGAREALAALPEGGACSPLQHLMRFVCHAVVARCSLAWEELGALRDSIEAARRALPPRAFAYAERLLAGIHAVCAGAFEEAGSAFEEAAEALGRAFGGEARFLVCWARGEAWLAKSLSRTAASTPAPAGDRGAESAWRRAVAASFASLGPMSDGRRGGQLLLRLDYLVAFAERLCKNGVFASGRAALDVVRHLGDIADAPLRRLGSHLAERLARVGPALLRLALDAVQHEVGHIIAVTPDPRSIQVALGVAGEIASPRRPKPWGFKAAGSMRLELKARMGRSAARDSREWWRRCGSAVSLFHIAAETVRQSSGRAGETERVVPAVSLDSGGSRKWAVDRVHLRTRWRGNVAVVGVEAREEPGGRCLGGVGEHDERSTANLAARAARSTGHAGGEASLEETLIGSSSAAKSIREFVRMAAACEYPVLLVGETGTGKEYVARSIHARSRRGGTVMVAANCGGISESLLEAELFGHVKGAFTGACESRDGVLARAHGTTLFLDEIDSMSPRAQAALLRALESGEYRPVGSAESRFSDFRLICAGLPRLARSLGDGTFRNDLYYRVSTLRLELPPLRERGDDACEIGASYARVRGARLSASALRVIAEYSWPGNVRELRNAIDAATVLGGSAEVSGEALAKAIASGRHGVGSPCSGAGPPSRRMARERWSRMLDVLAELQEFSACQFATSAGLSRRSAQRHLAALCRMGVVKRFGAGKVTVYRREGTHRVVPPEP